MQNETAAASKDNGTSYENELQELIETQLLPAGSIYAQLPIGIEIYDANGVLRSVNDYALHMYGIKDRSTVVDKVNLFKSPYMDEALLRKIQAGEEINLEFEYDFDRINQDAYFVSSNQNSMIYDVQIIPVRNKKNVIIGHILRSNDVTALREAEFRTKESQKNLEMAMETAGMSTWVYDINKKTVSPLYGDTVIKELSTLEELLAMMHPQDKSQLLQLFAQLENREVAKGNITVRFYNEEEKQYRYYESRMRLSSEHRGKLQIIGTQMDVTEKIQMAKKTQDLIMKRELAMQVSNIIHWDCDVRKQEFVAYNDPITDYVSDRPFSFDTYLNVMHPEDRSIANDAIQSMLAGEDSTIDFTCRMQTKYDKTWQYCHIIGVPFERDEEGNIIRFTGFRQNISKLHQLNEELKERNYKMELTFKTAGISYWDFDSKNRIFKSFNNPINDFNPDIPITVDEYLKVTLPEDTETLCEVINRMVRGVDEEINFQYHSQTKWHKEWQTMLVTGIPLERDKRGRVIRYTGIAFNNTKWETMTRELKELKEKAELSDRLKSAFLANMSHEIRTPLNAIVGFSELMANSDDQAEKEEYLDIIQANNEMLLNLINDILDLSKIESGILERKREIFNLSKVCNELYTMIQPKITSPGIEFIIDNPNSNCWILLDRNRLKQVWTNFLTNAVKHTRSGHIKMGYSVKKGGIRIYVEDTGSGIPQELQSRVFGRFQKLNEFAQGTGLGLAISRAIIEAAGGEVGFTSTPDEGSTFWAWIPCEINSQDITDSPTPQAPQQQSLLNTSKGKVLNVLVAEDNASNYSLVQHILKEHKLTWVQNGADAVNETRNGNFDLILMDIKMPAMDGLEATHEIRKFNPDIPIIALTANAFDSDKISATKAGCNAFLTKPLKRSQLLEIFSKEL